MTRTERRRVRGALTQLVTVLMGFTLAGCGNGGRQADSEMGAGAATIDTSNASAMDGLSTEQIERRAEPMTPHGAEHRGLPTVDPDSAPPSPP